MHRRSLVETKAPAKQGLFRASGTHKESKKGLRSRRLVVRIHSGVLLSTCNFVWFNHVGDAEAVRNKVLDELSGIAADVQATLEWREPTRLFASGEAAVGTDPWFTIELAIRPHEYFVCEEERVASQLPKRSKVKRLVTELLANTNTILGLTPLSEDADDVEVKLLSNLAKSNQPAVIGFANGDLIYDAMGKLIYPRSYLPFPWNRLS